MKIIYHRKRGTYLQFVGADTLMWTPNKYLAKRYPNAHDASEAMDDLELIDCAIIDVSTGNDDKPKAICVS